MIDVRALETKIDAAGDTGIHMSREVLLDIANELRLGNAARLLARAHDAVAGLACTMAWVHRR